MVIENFKKLGSSSLRKKGLEIINSGIEAINTEKIIRNKIQLKKNNLIIKNYNNKVKKINIKKYKKIVVIGFGKASSLMGKELEKVLGGKIDDGIIISTKKIGLKKIKVIKGTHPVPTLGNVKGTRKIVELVKGLSKGDLVICLVSGGGSALLCYPNVAFGKYLSSISKHFSSGIDINRLNKIRKGLSNVKDGKLAKLTKAKIVSLIFSDVVGDDLSTIASGPTVGKDLKNVDNILLLNNKVALEGMRKKALLLGFKPVVLTNTLKGEARLVGKNIIKKITNKKSSDKSLKNKKIKKSNGKIAYLFAGETTVTVRGKGKGGRCQELCLGAITDIAHVDGSVLICVGSDGIDGPTDAAGAIVDSDSLRKGWELGLDVGEALRENSSYAFFEKMNDLVFTGLTGSNVADIGVIIKL